MTQPTMPVLNKKELEAAVAEAVELLDKLTTVDGPEDPNRPAAAVNSFFLENAKGLIFEFCISAGVGVGFRTGHGFAIAKVDGKWSAPCFILIKALSVGAVAGIEKVSTLAVAASSKPLDQLSRGETAVVGKGLQHATLPLGLQGIDLSKAVTNPETDLYSVSAGKGLYLNFSLAGSVMTVDDIRNQAVFGAGTTGRTTLSGMDPVPAELAPLLAKIDELIAKGKGV